MKSNLGSSQRLPMKSIFSYSMGSIGDSAAFNFILSFASFFMTTIAGVSPIVAGTIISIAIVWDAITDPIIGFWVDKSKSKHGKRRPFILGSIVPMGASMVLLFLNVDLPQAQTNAYYLVLLLVFWTAYTAFNIPYYAFGGILTFKDEERIKLAAYREVFGYIGMFAATALPTFLVGKFIEGGMSDSDAWSYVAMIIAVITMSSIFYMWRFTRGKEPEDEVNDENNEKVKISTFFKEIYHLSKMKPYLLVIISAFFTFVYSTLFNSTLMYYATFNLGVSEAKASILFTAMTISSIALIPFVTKGITRFTKEKAFVVSMTISAATMILAKFVGIPNITMGIVYVVLVGIGTTAYWLCIFNFLYDVVDYDEFKNGKRRDGIFMSYYSFLLKLGGALAAWLQGFLLQTGGFDLNLKEQSQSALDTISSLFTLYPGISMLIAGLVMLLTPLTHKRMVLLREQLLKKNNNEPYSTKGLEDIL